MLVFRRFFGVSDCRVPHWVPYVAFSSSPRSKKIRDAGCEIHIKKFLKEAKMTITIHSHGNLLLF